MKVAVTTASGLLGKAIIKELVNEIGADNVVGIARSPEKVRIKGIDVRKGDYNSLKDFEESLKGVDAVLIVSGNAHPDERIKQHRNIIEAAKINKVKKIVYTSINGAEEGNEFSFIVASNRKTEEDVRNSGMNWAIGRNGIYIEPDLDYLENYKKAGAIINSAGDGKCGYTSRTELAVAYTRMILDNLSGVTFNLLGEPITQQQLADAINRQYDLNIAYKSIEPEEFIKDRQAELGEFLGTIIGGIYEGIRTGEYDGKSDFEIVTGRPHKTVDEMIQEYKESK